MAKERPILFSTPMVQAIMQGRKTQTRRVVKVNKSFDFQSMSSDKGTAHFYDGFFDGLEDLGNPHKYIKCPYGQPGDVFWVREGFTWVGKKEDPIKYLYKAEPTHDSMRWKPSIHMPKDAARIWLRITDVRVERLQDISEADAISEGIIHKSMNDPKVEFQHLWQSINEEESWQANPWVWVVSFEVLSTTGRKEAQP